MSQTNVKTIKLQGKDYAQVNDRIKAFHAKYPNGSITTEPNLTGEVCFVKAIVTPDVANPARVYSASSYGTLKGVKAFEKLETVAVGRALAYLGFSIDGSIASAEEMEEFVSKQEEVKPVQITVQRPNEAQIKRLQTLVSKATDPEATRAWIKSTYKVESTKDLTIDQYNKLTTALEEKINK